MRSDLNTSLTLEDIITLFEGINLTELLALSLEKRLIFSSETLQSFLTQLYHDGNLCAFDFLELP